MSNETWEGTIPAPEAGNCPKCGQQLVRDCAGIVCDYCWRVAKREFEDEDNESRGDDGDED